MKTTIIDLLNKIANGEAPKRIVFEHREWEWVEEGHDYWVVHERENEADWTLFIDEMHKYYNGVQDYLNDEVEILETTITYNPDKIWKLNIALYDDNEITTINKMKHLADKINEIIDKINGE